MKIYSPTGLVKRLAVPTFNVPVAATIAASVDDLAPSGWGSVTNRLQITAAQFGSLITGLDVGGHQDGQAVALLNDSTVVTDAVSLANESTSSLAANRFTCPGGEDVDILPGGGVLLLRIGSRWRVL